MSAPTPVCLLRREYEPAALLAAHPPVLRHPHKKLLFEIRAAVRVLRPPTRTNLLAMAAPAGGRGLYFRHQLERILTTAYTGFRAGAADFERVLAAGTPGEALAEFIERIGDLDSAWGVSDGN